MVIMFRLHAHYEQECMVKLCMLLIVEHINLALPDSYARAVRDGSEGVWGSAYTKSVLMNLIINAK